LLKTGSVRIGCIILLLFVFNSYALDEYYTLQLGSFKQEGPALKLYGLLLKELDKTYLRFLRVERIKDYYVVRIGKDSSYKEAIEFANVIRNRFPDSILMKAFYIRERIIKEYNYSENIENKQALKDDRNRDDLDSTKKTLQMDLDSIIKKISYKSEQGNYDEAIALLDSALKRWPESGRLYGWKGTVLLKQERVDEAISAFKRAVELSPNQAEYHNGLGYSFLYKKEYVNALKEFDKALIINPEYVDALAGLGLTYVELGYKEHAMETYRKLKGIDEDAAKKLFQIIIMRL